MNEQPPLERVARALFRMFRGGRPQGETWRDYIDDARTVLEAIREPSEGMIWAGAGEDQGEAFAVIEWLPQAWQAMIDTALEEG